LFYFFPHVTNLYSYYISLKTKLYL